MSSDIRVGRGSNIAPKIGRYRLKIFRHGMYWAGVENHQKSAEFGRHLWTFPLSISTFVLFMT